jgi:enoyl-[acyl-carrier protein] reductase I
MDPARRSTEEPSDPDTNGCAMLLKDKKGLIFGVANGHSIAWAIAQEAANQGATLGFTYLNDAMERRVRPLAESVNSPIILPCDACNDDELDNVFKAVDEQWDGQLDFVVHSIAFAQRDDLKGKFVDTSRDGFRTALEVSAFSLVAMAQRAASRMTDGGSIITMTYHGSQQVVPNYNVMGVAKAALEASVRYLATDLGDASIRVNAVSAGPVKTLSAKGISGFGSMLKNSAEIAPLKRNVEIAEVAKTAVFLLSDYSSGVTGEVLYVDAGLNTRACV